MATRRRLAIERLSFLTSGNFSEEDPSRGLEETLNLIERGEELGYSGAWVRQRHLECGISSAATVLAAATQRTSRIELGVGVIQMGYENPLRLAEDLATVDILSRGRLQVGLSAGKPVLAGVLGDRFLDAGADAADYSHARVSRLAHNLAGEFFGSEDAEIVSAGGRHRPRVRPHAPGLVDRLWYGGGSVRSVEWAARNGLNLLVGNINVAEQVDSFIETQRRHIELFRASSTRGEAARIAVGRVIIPLDSADRPTRNRYLAFAAERTARTLAPQGERRTQFAPDIVGSADEILDKLSQDGVLSEARELRLELPYNLPLHDYLQIIEDVIGKIAPEIGFHASGPTELADAFAWR
ncbi:LLM class flavin-dependent oxidoreductase [Terrarubrum flagellatum]|uniref:LLM class flavin-dependent oxidoreductase n=1 Tax=Terrirubrum flagellatum TaxID=2895980 RepID=UPI0031456F53